MLHSVPSVFAGLVLAPILLACMAAGGLEQPSVLVVVADDVGEGEWALQPKLQALASGGVRFTRAYGYPICSPTRYGLMFGRYQRREGLGGNETTTVDPAAPRLPMALRSIVEAVGLPSALVGKWHSGRAPLFGLLDESVSGPFAFGFDHWLAGSPTALSLGGGTGYRDWPRTDDGELVTETVYATIAQRDAFIAWWSSTPGPKFGMLSWSAAHAPWDRVPGFTAAAWGAFTDRAKFEKTVGYMDAQLGVVLDEVNLSETFVVWVGDNGTPNAARPSGSEFDHWKFTTWEGGIHVSLVVAGPGVVAGLVSDRLVSVVDVPATLAELVGIGAAFDDSLSFADELGAWTGTAARPFVFTERYDGDYDDQAVIEEVWKLRRVDPDGPDGPLPSADSFYVYPDLPLQPMNQEIIDRLVAELESIAPRLPH